MKLLVRTLTCLIAALVKPALPVEGASRCRFRVLPSDLDIKLHMNSGRFQQVMDVGRLDWLMRTGILRNAISKKRRLVLGGVMTQYVRDLRPFEPYVLSTRLLGWKSASFFLEHRFEDRRGMPVAVGIARAFMVSPAGVVPAPDVAREHGRCGSPELPPSVCAWQDAERRLRLFERSRRQRSRQECGAACERSAERLPHAAEAGDRASTYLGEMR